MDTKPFRYILKIAELGSISKAADELFVAQPSLSQYLRRIERELGQPLFDRSTNPLRLTVAGEQYVEFARATLARYQDLRDAMTQVGNYTLGRLRVGLSRSRAAHLLPLVLPEFAAAHPKVEVETLEAGDLPLRQALASGDLDFALISSLDDDGEFPSRVLGLEELVLVANAEQGRMLFGEAPEVTWDRISGQRMIVLPRHRSIRTAVQALFDTNEANLVIKFTTGSNEAAIRLASAGLGLAIAPATFVAESQPVAAMRVYPLSPRVRWRTRALWHPDRPCGFLAREWLTIAEKHLSKSVD